ncbi:unnamed protein product [Cuscuta epithymum]|uniref:Reverse transcriptase zinc-binding domain-containing protein n=1 Tax=Cuscuta epithymum TaxID=186058 RepID=A0AAV0ELG3_9ASTE|nr:unnamed protein product [Cuscuta epithymum]
MAPKIYDSVVWRRICHIHEEAASLCTVDNTGTLLWNEEIKGHFTLKSAYEEARVKQDSTFTFKHIWHSQQELKVKLLLWKIIKGLLPISDQLKRFKMVLEPSMCVMCRNHSDNLNHIFYQCHNVKLVWHYFMKLFEISIPQSDNIAQVFRNWWMKAGTKNVMDIFKHNLPGIISWQVWKVYANLVWGNPSGNTAPSPKGLISQIKAYTQNWVRSFPKLHNNSVNSILKEEQIVTWNFQARGNSLQIIRWRKPNNCYKMNVDARYLSGEASGGAIIRNSEGDMLWATSFPLAAVNYHD